MSARTLAILTAVLVAAPAAYADFSADLVLSTTTPIVNPGDEVVVTVSLANLTLNPSSPGDDISRISLNFSDSDQDLSGGTWVWDTYITNTLGLNVDDDTMEYVQASITGMGVTPGQTDFDLGTLTFNAPAAEGTYTIDMGAGSQPGDVTVVADGDTYMMDQDIYASGHPLTLGTLDITVLPEPATLALLGMGGAALLLRRRRR